MEEKSIFDATVTRKMTVCIPAATRDRLGIARGDILRVSIEKVPKIGSERR